MGALHGAISDNEALAEYISRHDNKTVPTKTWSHLSSEVGWTSLKEYADSQIGPQHADFAKAIPVWAKRRSFVQSLTALKKEITAVREQKSRARAAAKLAGTPGPQASPHQSMHMVRSPRPMQSGGTFGGTFGDSCSHVHLGGATAAAGGHGFASFEHGAGFPQPNFDATGTGVASHMGFPKGSLPGTPGALNIDAPAPGVSVTPQQVNALAEAAAAATRRELQPAIDALTELNKKGFDKVNADNAKTHAELQTVQGQNDAARMREFSARKEKAEKEALERKEKAEKEALERKEAFEREEQEMERGIEERKAQSEKGEERHSELIGALKKLPQTKAKPPLDEAVKQAAVDKAAREAALALAAVEAEE